MSTLNGQSSEPGLIADGVDGTPWVSGTLSFDDQRGIVVDVPFVEPQGAPQFEATSQWFQGTDQSQNVTMFTDRGTYTLIHCNYSQVVRHRSNGLRLGTIRPEIVVSRLRGSNLQEPLRILEMRSVLDGLQDWTDSTSFVAIHEQNDEDPHRTKITIDFPEQEAFTWHQGDLTMFIGPDASWESSHRSFRLDDAVYLTSTCDTLASFDEHLIQQKRISSLLTVLNGAPAYFRKHALRDPQFPETFISGETAYVPFQEVFSQKTFQESLQPDPVANNLKFPLVYLQEVGPAGLAKWSSIYESWNRVIQPLESIFRRRTAPTDAFISTCIAMEAAGHLLGQVRDEDQTYTQRERSTTATYIFRCVSQIPADWSPCSESALGVSKAIAKMYNDIKHFDRQATPSSIEMLLFCRLSIVIARLVVVGQLDPDGSLTTKMAARAELKQSVSAFKESNMLIRNTGEVECAR